jgi:hypothetical protein
VEVLVTAGRGPEEETFRSMEREAPEEDWPPGVVEEGVCGEAVADVVAGEDLAEGEYRITEIRGRWMPHLVPPIMN